MSQQMKKDTLSSLIRSEQRQFRDQKQEGVDNIGTSKIKIETKTGDKSNQSIIIEDTVADVHNIQASETVYITQAIKIMGGSPNHATQPIGKLIAQTTQMEGSPNHATQPIGKLIAQTTQMEGSPNHAIQPIDNPITYKAQIKANSKRDKQFLTDKRITRTSSQRHLDSTQTYRIYQQKKRQNLSFSKNSNLKPLYYMQSCKQILKIFASQSTSQQHFQLTKGQFMRILLLLKLLDGDDYSINSNQNLRLLATQPYFINLHKFMKQKKIYFNMQDQRWYKRCQKHYIKYKQRKQQQQHEQLLQQNVQQYAKYCSQFDDLKQFVVKLSNYQFFQKILKKIARISEQSYQIRYIQDFTFINQKIGKKQLRNVAFYLNEHQVNFFRSQPMNLKQILKERSKDYDWLENRHDYIQWLFPNHFESRFNSDAYPLSYIQSQIFNQSQQIGNNLLASTKLFLDFMGISLLLSQEKIQLGLCSKPRLEKVLIHYVHNHMRIMRILACLSITGFRIIAKALIDFLRKIIKKDSKFKYLKKTFQQSWQVYDDNGISNSEEAKRMCFLQFQDFPPCHKTLKELLKTETPTIEIKIEKITINVQSFD